MRNSTKHANNNGEKRLKKLDKFKLFSSIVKILLIINICVIGFFRFFSDKITHTAALTIWFYISLAIYVIALLLLFNKKMLKKKVLYSIIVVIFIVLMIALPVYKVEGEENVVDDSKTSHTSFAGVNYTITYEDVVNYTDYYNFYGLKLHRSIENEE